MTFVVYSDYEQRPLSYATNSHMIMNNVLCPYVADVHMIMKKVLCPYATEAHSHLK